MKVLITGGYGFIGSHMADRFFKEGHEILIIDNLVTGSIDHVGVKHRFYRLNVADKQCEEVFKTHAIDVVIHLAAQVDTNISNGQSRLDTESNILGLVNMLDLAHKYHVKKFLFASSAAVYGDTEVIPATEDVPANPLSVYGINKCVGEEYCRKWKEIYGLDTKVFRLANVYGPRQGANNEGGVVSIFIRKLLNGEDLKIFGDGNQTRDFVYVEDVVDAFYRAVQLEGGNTGQALHVSTNTERSLHDLIQILESEFGTANVSYAEKRKGDILRSCLDNSRIYAELRWKPKYSFEEGIGKTADWFNDRYENLQRSENKSSPNPIRKTFRKVLPYLENLVLFGILVSIGGFFLNHNTINTTLGLDYCYLYIIIMGIVYGRRQSFLASLLSIGLYTGFYVLRGGDLVTIIYQPTYILHLLGYILLGVITGYAIENRERKLAASQMELENLTTQHEFIKKMYVESNQVREELQAQIINYDDSLGKIYQITKQLDTLEKEEVFTSVVEIIEKMMRSRSVSIYTVNKNGTYLRLKYRSADGFFFQQSSLRIDDFPYLREVVRNKRFYVNKELIKDLPMMATPIIHEGETIAIVQIHQLEFENFSLYHENLFRILAMMITDALTRAYLHETNYGDQKYLPGTKILKTEEFSKILSVIKKRKEKSSLQYTVFALRTGDYDYNEIYWRLSTVIREDDYIGVGPDGRIYILLVNTRKGTSKEIIGRMKLALTPVRHMVKADAI